MLFFLLFHNFDLVDPFFVKQTLFENPQTAQRGGVPISGEAVRVFQRFETKDSQAPIRSKPEALAVNLPANAGVQLHPQSEELRIIQTSIGPCDPRNAFPTRFQPFEDAFQQLQITDLSNVGKLTVPQTREPVQRALRLPAVDASNFSPAIPTDLPMTPVPGNAGGKVGNRYEVFIGL